MMTLKDIRNDRKLLNAIDWDMTPEEAVRLYLEWGCNWARSNYVIRSNDDVSHYFVVNTWKDRPRVFLIRRNHDEAVELAEFYLPEEIEKEFMEGIGTHKGVYPVEGSVRQWLRRELAYDA